MTQHRHVGGDPMRCEQCWHAESNPIHFERDRCPIIGCLDFCQPGRTTCEGHAHKAGPWRPITAHDIESMARDGLEQRSNVTLVDDAQLAQPWPDPLTDPPQITEKERLLLEIRVLSTKLSLVRVETAIALAEADEAEKQWRHGVEKRGFATNAKTREAMNALRAALTRAETARSL